MKLKALTLALALTTPALLSARALNALTYTAHANTPFQWTDISTTGSRLTGSGELDDVTVSSSLGSSFQFYGGVYNSVTVSTNGNLQFLSDNNDYFNTTLSNSSFGPSIFAFWDDLYFSDAGSPEQGIYYQYFAGGVHPSFSGPTSVFQWTGTYCCGLNPSDVRVQALLNHSTGSILIQLNNAPGLRGQGGSATIGIQDGNGQYVQWLANVDEEEGGEEPVVNGPGRALDSEPLNLQSTVTFDASPVPEPSTYALIGLGLAGMAVIRRRNK